MYMFDKEFLLKLDQHRDREIYARVTALTLDESPVETIEGRISNGGSINIDGKSSVRRTFNLTLIANDLSINDFYWGIKTKIKLEIGLKNKIDSNYPDIIWFKQGIYVLTSFSTSQSVNNFSISMSGKDKMCLLNGELGGVINSSVNFSKLSYYDKVSNTTIEQDIEIKDIIKEALYNYGGESLHNIIINDLNEHANELQEYRGDTPLYLFRSESNENPYDYENISLDDSTEWYYKINNSWKGPASLKVLSTDKTIGFKFDVLDNLLNEDSSGSQIRSSKDSSKIYRVAKIEYGETVGSKEVPLTYPSADGKGLIANAGDSVTSVLDKIISFLGDYEYFYDIDGRFIFQRQAIYENKSWNNLIDEEGNIFAESAMLSSSLTYSFDNSSLVQSISNTPRISEVKNDYTVWGVRKNINGNEIDIHARYAIDVKPTYYKQITVSDNDVSAYQSLTGESLVTQTNPKEFTTDEYDWREIIYQMALDYRKYNHLDDFEIKVAAANKDYYPNGKTGYEQYYIDMEGFWRQLYDPEAKIQYTDENQYNENFYVKHIQRINTDNEDIKNYKGEDLYLIILNGGEPVELIRAIDWMNLFELPINETKNYDLYYKIPESDSTDELPYILNSINLTPLILYYKEGNKYIPLKEKFKDKIYIKNPINNNSYLPALDLFDIKHVDFLTSNQVEKEKWTYYLNGDKTKIIFLFDKDDKQLSTINAINANAVKYSIEGSSGFIDLKSTDVIYIKTLRNDLDYKEWYCKKNNDFVLFEKEYLTGSCFNASTKLRKSDLYIKKESGGYTNLKALVNLNKNNIYVRNNKTYTLLIDKLPAILDTIIKNSIKHKGGSISNIFKRTDNYKLLSQLNKAIPASPEKYYTMTDLPDVKKMGFSATNRSALLYNTYTVTNTDGLHKRSYPNGKAPIIENTVKFSKGDIITIVQYEGDWGRVANTDWWVRIHNGKKKYYYATRLNRFLSSKRNFLGQKIANEDYSESFSYYSHYYDYNLKGEKNEYWSKMIFEDPHSLNFWIDFLDTTGDISKYSVKTIGDRPKVVSDNNAKSIYYREVPTIIFIDADKDKNKNIDRKSGYTYIQIPSFMWDLFGISNENKSIMDVITQNLYQYGYCQNSISLSVAPIYYLEPNTKILIRDDKSKINGEYIINQLSIPLSYNGMMNINASIAIEKLY